MHSLARPTLLLTVFFVAMVCVEPQARSEDVSDPIAQRASSSHSVRLGPPALDSHGHAGHIHHVVSGDTLWDISDAYLGTAWAWPSIWNENTKIENPHRIWPGDHIWISEYEMRRLTAAEADALLADGWEPPSTPASPDFGKRAPEGGGPLAFEGAGASIRPPDARRILDSISFVSPETLSASATIVDSPEERIWLAGGDPVYLGLGEGDVEVGDRLDVFRHVEAIRDLRTRRVLGHHVGILGWLEVTEVQGDSSVAEIRVSVAEMARGDRVTPREQWPEMISPGSNGDVHEGQIVFLPTPRSVMGTLDPVYIDRGSKHGLHPGSELEIIEGGRAVQDAVRRSSVKTPTRVIGGMVILATQKESALAVVTHARRELERGDAVRSLPPEEVAGL
jgi:hypothetical protein